MKKLIIIAIALVSTSMAYAQNKQTNDKYAYSKEGLTAENIQIREKAIQEMKIEEQRQKIVHAQTTEFLANQAKEAQKPVVPSASEKAKSKNQEGLLTTKPNETQINQSAKEAELRERIKAATTSGTPGRR